MSLRRLFLLGIAAASLSSAPAFAQISDNVVKIGVLTDMNGPASTPTGQGSVTAAQMAVDDFGGTVLGKPISVVVGDHQDKPDVGASIARRWYDTEQVDLIVDVPVSAVGLAVQSVANEKKRLFITHSTGTADFHGKFCSPYTMQWVFDTRALAVGTAQEVVKRGGDSWFFITDDYAFGHSLERDASSVIVKNGGKVVGSVSPPFATPDLSSFILQAQASKAKIIGIAGGPPNNINEIKTAGEFGVMKGGRLEQIATPRKLYEAPCSRWVAEFVGDVNIFEGEARIDESGRIAITTRDAGTILASTSSDPPAQSQVCVAIRPEKIRLARCGPASSMDHAHAGANGLEGTVTDVNYLGGVTIYKVKLDSGIVLRSSIANTARLNSDAYNASQRVVASFSPDDCVVLER